MSERTGTKKRLKKGKTKLPQGRKLLRGGGLPIWGGPVVNEKQSFQDWHSSELSGKQQQQQKGERDQIRAANEALERFGMQPLKRTPRNPSRKGSNCGIHLARIKGEKGRIKDVLRARKALVNWWGGRPRKTFNLLRTWGGK